MPEIKVDDILSEKGIEDAGLENTGIRFADMYIFKDGGTRYLLKPNEKGLKVFEIYTV